jgi:glycosyltransferase involved in cell wall biosynthesis
VAPGMWIAAGQGGEAFDLVHVTAFPYAWPMVCGLRLARRLRVPFLLTPFLHLGNAEDPGDPMRRAYLSPALMALVRAVDGVFVQTKVEEAALINQGVSGDKLFLQGMGVDAAECTGGNRARIRQEWGVGLNEIVIGHLANNSIEKGTVDLLGAAERAWQAGQRFHVILAGPEMPNFRRFVRNCCSPPWVRRLGILTEQQKRDFFAGLDIFALPSRSDSFGLVLLEAWANGLPNVAYRAGGVAAVIRHESDGLLVNCGDETGLTEALCRLIKDGKLRSRLGTAGQQRTRQEFQWKDKLDRVRRVYQEMVRGE